MDATTKQELLALVNLPDEDLRAQFREALGEEPPAGSKRWQAKQILRARAARAEEIADAAHDATPSGDGVAAASTDSIARASDAIESEAGATTADAPTEEGVRHVRAMAPEEGATSAEPAPGDGRAAVDVRATDGAEATASDTSTSSLRVPKRVARGRGARTRAAEATRAKRDAPAKPLPLSELRRRYAAVVGRTTRSRDRAYLTSKIREAERERVRFSPAPRGRDGAERNADWKPINVRIEKRAIEPMDSAWRRKGYASRQAFLVDAIVRRLKAIGEPTAASKSRLRDERDDESSRAATILRRTPRA